MTKAMTNQSYCNYSYACTFTLGLTCYTRNCIELLKRGANPNLKDINGCVPLHYAAESGSLDVIKLLLNHHANVDAV